MYRPSKKPRNTWVFFVCSHSPPTLNVCLPWTIEKLSLNWKRVISSSTLGARKNGLPNRNVVEKPIAVSGGTFEGIAERGRSSREYVMWNSLSLVADTVVKRLMFPTLIFDGPSMPFAEVP